MDEKLEKATDLVADDIYKTVASFPDIHPNRLTLPHVKFGSSHKVDYQIASEAMACLMANGAVWAAFLELTRTDAARDFRTAFADCYIETWADLVAEAQLGEKA